MASNLPLQRDQEAAPKGAAPALKGSAPMVAGLAPGAKPDEDDNWKVQDLWFYAPGETPPDDWVPQGEWTYAPGNLEGDWLPPKKDATKEGMTTGKLKLQSPKAAEEKTLRSPKGIMKNKPTTFDGFKKINTPSLPHLTKNVRILQPEKKNQMTCLLSRSFVAIQHYL
jgi:hypothetical protein